MKVQEWCEYADKYSYWSSKHDKCCGVAPAKAVHLLKCADAVVEAEKMYHGTASPWHYDNLKEAKQAYEQAKKEEGLE